METDAEDIVQVHLTIDLPKNGRLTILSLSYPDLKISLLSLLPLSPPQGLALLKVNGLNLESFLADLSKLYIGPTHSVLGKQESEVLFSLELVDPWILNHLMKLEMNTRYPILIQAGKMQLELISPRNKIDILLNQFNISKLDVKLNRIGRVHLNPLLTSQQEELLNHALDQGFFEIPRKITLKEFAMKEGISASALSEKLRRTIKKLIKKYLRNNS